MSIRFFFVHHVVAHVSLIRLNCFLNQWIFRIQESLLSNDLFGNQSLFAVEIQFVAENRLFNSDNVLVFFLLPIQIVAVKLRQEKLARKKKPLADWIS